MFEAKVDGQQNCRRPETEALRQGVQGEAAIGKFLEQRDHQENERPLESPSGDGDAVQSQRTEGVTAKRGEKSDQRRDFAETEEATLPEAATERSGNRKSIRIDTGILKARQEQCCTIYNGKGGNFLGQHQQWRGRRCRRIEKQFAKNIPRGPKEPHDGNVEQESPQRTKARGELRDALQ